MLSEAAMVGVFFISSVVLSAGLLAIFFRIRYLQDNLLSSVGVIGLNFVLTIVVLASAFWNDYDFVADVGKMQFVMTAIVTLGLLIVILFNNQYANAIALLLAISLLVWGGDWKIVFDEQWSDFANEFLTVVVWFLFASGFYVVSGLYPVPQLIVLTVCAGFLFMAFLGVVPKMMVLAIVSLAGVLIISCFNAKIQPIYSKVAPFLGFVTGWIGVASFEEFLLPNFLVLVMFYLLELGVSCARKITLLPRYKNMMNNTVLMQAFVEGVPEEKILKFFMASNVVLVFLSGFQVFGENVYSVPLFSLVVVAWQLHRVIHWQDKEKNFREASENVVKEFKKFFSKNKSDEKNDFD